MKYSYDFQFLPKGSRRPQDDGAVVAVETDDKGFALVPNVGDYVQILRDVEGNEAFDGRVRSRLFRYFGNQQCSVNIVVEQVEDENVWGLLVKE